jgi:ABC-type nitrate/sulfonate/bicarbonate transport system permease component
MELTRTLKLTVLGLILPVGLIVLWEIAANNNWINVLFYPAPSEIMQRTWEHLTDGKLINHSEVTFKRLMIGFVVGAVPGIGLGLAAGIIPAIRHLLYPMATALYVVPRIALLPLVLVAMSVGDPARIFMVAFSVFFIVFFSALSAAEQVETTHIDTARAFGANHDRVVRSVLLPGSAPAIFSGLRVAMGVALIIIVSTEFLASNNGLGAFIWRSYQIFDFPSMYTGIVAVTIFGVLVNWALLAVEWTVIPWRR